MATDDERSQRGGSLIDGVADWLMAQALSDVELDDLLTGCCERLSAAGIPLARGHIAFRTLHPLYHGVGLTWRRGEGLETARFPRDQPLFPEVFRQGPLFHMIDKKIPHLRRRLTGDEALLDFQVLGEYRDQGMTDYLAYLVAFSGDPHDGLAGSWTTDRPSGFSARDLRSLLRIQRRLGVACKITIREQIARNVLATYLGPVAGNKVLDGRIRRGDGETIHAVIWYSDLRDSTGLADRLPQEEFLQLLNGYFETTAGAVLAEGGEVLLLIGDAVLAVFPIGDGASGPQACERALAAAREADARLEGLNRARGDLEPLDFGLGLHLGDVIYGNIGVPERLQFTVVGRAVNEVARLEDLTKKLGRRVLVSGDFARQLPIDWQSQGAHDLRGLEQPIEVFAPPPE